MAIECNEQRESRFGSRQRIAFQRTAGADWCNWRWQQQNSVTTVHGLRDVFDGLDEALLLSVADNLKDRRLSLTPYILSLIEECPGSNRPIPDDPIWKQVVPDWGRATTSPIEYNGTTENWELQGEMKTPICQHKYKNRVIVRVASVCHSYCQFCYEALRTLERKSIKEVMKQKHWSDTLEYIRTNEDVEEVILSGGEPFMLSDDKLEDMLSSLRGIGRRLAIRIHTRSLTFNPFRVTQELAGMLEMYEVQAIGLHVVCQREVTSEFREAITRLSKAGPILFANIPLLRGINDSPEEMKELCMSLYRTGVVPHYLYHFMPFSPGVLTYRTPIQKGVEIIRSMKRHISNIAVPEFVLPHSTGKFTVPISHAEAASTVWATDSRGYPVVRYTNWRGDEVEYSDVN